MTTSPKFGALGAALAALSLLRHVPHPPDSGEPEWRRCARGWGASAEGLAAIESRSVLQSPDDLVWVAAVVTAESAWRVGAVSSAGAQGPLQLTDDGAAEAALECRLPVVPAIQLRGWRSAVRYGTCLLRFDLREVDGEWEQALMLYNGGFRQLARWRQGLGLVEETREYVKEVRQLHDQCVGGQT